MLFLSRRLAAYAVLPDPRKTKPLVNWVRPMTLTVGPKGVAIIEID